MKHLSYRSALLVAGACVLISTSGCLIPDSGSESGTEIDILPPPVEAPNPNTYSCNALDGENVSPAPREQGVRGTLYYLDSTQPRYNNVADYLANGNLVSDVALYFSRIFIPTRPFDRGFVTHAGETILNHNDNTLYEYFAIRHEGRIQLGSKPPGLYQMAVLSDDGAMFSMDFTGANYENVVSNDNNHPTRMACASIPVELSATDKIPFLLDYYQGPRYHISLILMWRPWPADGAQDPFCGVQGNSFYFNSNVNPPAPTANYLALEARGWEPLAPENYLLPESSEPNPCNEPAPVISGFTVTAITNSTITVAWTTDRPATSQVQYRRSNVAVPTLTDSDGQWRTSHVVTITGLTANSDYIVQGVSASSSGLSTESSQLTVRTRR